MGLKEKQIAVIIKEPNKVATVEYLFPNELKEFQKIVGGYIETYTPSDADFCIVCDEEGRLKGKEFNFHFGRIPFVGTCIFVGIGADEFKSLSNERIKELLFKLGNPFSH